MRNTAVGYTYATAPISACHNSPVILSLWSE